MKRWVWGVISMLVVIFLCYNLVLKNMENPFMQEVNNFLNLGDNTNTKATSDKILNEDSALSTRILENAESGGDYSTKGSVEGVWGELVKTLPFLEKANDWVQTNVFGKEVSDESNETK